MTSTIKDVNIDELPEIVQKYYNTFHRGIKMRSIDIKLETCIDWDIEINTKNLNLRSKVT